MKRIIKTYMGSEYVYDIHDSFEFTCRLFACLAGLPKKVTVECGSDVDFNEVYIIELI